MVDEMNDTPDGKTQHASDDVLAKMVEQDRTITNLQLVLKDICEEWNEDCNADCDSVAHSETCKATNIAEAKKAMRLEIAGLQRELAALKATSAEPVAWLITGLTGTFAIVHKHEAVRAALDGKITIVPLYTAPPEAQLKAAQVASKVKYDEFMEGETEDDPVERLRFFLSIALRGRDWLDVEPFIDDVTAQLKAAQREVLEKAAQWFYDNRRHGEIWDELRRMIDEL